MSESLGNRCPICGVARSERAEGLCPKCLLMRAAEATDAPGTHRVEAPSIGVVAAAFPQLEIIELIGQGGMGCVFKARQPQLNRFVAVKILPEALSRDTEFASRFTREAQALAALSHPNIVTVHDFGRANGFFFLLMEFVDGVNLRQALQGERFTPEQALAIVPPICDALQYAHERGIVHRDIKPENLLLDKTGRVKIADFGIAKMLDASGARLWSETQSQPGEAAELAAANRADTAAVHGKSSLAAGTPQYMAPEQRKHSKRADHRADIYSLGVVLYELLTGELPGATLQPPSARVQIDVRLDEVVLRALAQEPELRYATAREFKTHVETIAGRSESAARMPSKPPNTAPVSDSSRSYARLSLALFLCALLGTPLLMTISHRHELALIFGAGALVLAAVFGFLGWQQRLGKVIALISIGIPVTGLVAALLWIGIYQFLTKPAAIQRAQQQQDEKVLRTAAIANEHARTNAPGSDIRARSAGTGSPALMPREVVGQWLAQVKSNRTEAMWDLTTRESGGAGSVDLRNTWQFDRIKAYTLAMTSNAAMVVTTLFEDNAGRERRIVFSLVSRNGRWLIRDHWTASPEVAESRLDGFVTGSRARFDVRHTDIIGRWHDVFFSPALFEFREDGIFSTNYRIVGGARTNFVGTWSLTDDQLIYQTEAGGITGRVVNVREDFFQLLLTDGNMGSYHRVVERPTSGQGTPHFEPVVGVTLTTNYVFSFKGGKVERSKRQRGGVGLLSEKGRMLIEFDDMHAIALQKDKGIEEWSSKSAAELVREYQNAGFGLLPFERFSEVEIKVSELPLTFLLPGEGFLQVFEAHETPIPEVKLRYKLVGP